MQGLLFAIAAGGLIGIEREHARLHSKRKVYPIFGIRTTLILSVFGFLCAYLSIGMSNNTLIFLGAIITLVISTAVYLSNMIVFRYTGATTYVTMLVVFFIGVLAGMGGQFNFIIAASLATIVTLILAARKNIISWIKGLTSTEIMDAAKFGIIALIILPLLPNEYLGPLNLVNPYKIWYVVVLVSAIYFISYIFLKKFSKKGLVISSVFGGFIGGTPTTYQLAGWVKNKSRFLNQAVSGVFSACLAGQISDMILITFVFGNLVLLRMIALPYLASIITLSFLAYWSFEKTKKEPASTINVKSPFAFKPALTFGGLYLCLVVFGGLLSNYFGHLGLLPTTISGSLFSSTAVMASLANLSKEGVVLFETASNYVIFAAIIALLIKVFWVQYACNKKLSMRVLAGTALASIVMGLVFVLQSMFLF